MDMTKELPKAIKMSWEDEDWVQTLYYEHILLICRRCHEYGDLLGEWSMKSLKSPPEKEEDKNCQGFIRVPLRKRGGRKHENMEATKKISVSNQFEALGDQPEEITELSTNEKQ